MDLKAVLADEFALSQKIVRDGHEVVPRFRIFAPDGEHVALVQLPEAIEGRMERFEVMRKFLIWKAASGFILSSELVSPEVILGVAVTRSEVFGAFQAIRRNPVRFGRLQWLRPDELDEQITGLLPPKKLEVSKCDLEFMRHAFEEGKVEGITWRGLES